MSAVAFPHHALISALILQKVSYEIIYLSDGTALSEAEQEHIDGYMSALVGVIAGLGISIIVSAWILIGVIYLGVGLRRMMWRKARLEYWKWNWDLRRLTYSTFYTTGVFDWFYYDILVSSYKPTKWYSILCGFKTVFLFLWAQVLDDFYCLQFFVLLYPTGDRCILVLLMYWLLGGQAVRCSAPSGNLEADYCA